MEKILIKFSDNDFCNTLRPFTEAIAPQLLLGEWNATEQDVADLFNEHAYSFYCVYQARKPILNGERTKKYLKISADCVFFDKDADRFLDENMAARANGEWCLAYLDNDDIKCYIV